MGSSHTTLDKCQRCGEAFTEKSERAEVVHYPTSFERTQYGGQAVLLDDFGPDDWPHFIVHQSCMIDGDEIA